MKVRCLLLLLLIGIGLVTGCTATNGETLPNESMQSSVSQQETASLQPSETPKGVEESQNEDILLISIFIGDAVFKARLDDNQSAKALWEQLPMTLEMADYAAQEKVITLPFAMPPAKTEKPDTIREGEIYLWSGNQLVLFYTTFANKYDGYVRLGAIEDVDGLTEALGSGNVTITLNCAQSR